MTTLKFADTHNMVSFLSKPVESEGFEQIVDFLNAHPIKYALTVNPTIYTSCIEQFWATVKAKTRNKEVQLQTLVDGKKIIITESIARRDLQLEDAEATNQKFNFSKYIFESMVKNLDNVSGNFLMYPRFIQMFVNQQLEGMPAHNRIYIAPAHTKKIFGNMRRIGKGFSGRDTPLFPTMVKQRLRRSKRKDTEVPQPSGPTTNVADEVVNEEMDDSLVRAATTATSLDAKQDRGYIKKTRSKETLNEPSSSGTSSRGGPRRQETIGDKIAQTRLKLEELMALCTTLQLRVLALETIKTTQANETTSLKKRVKKLDRRKKSRTQGLKRLYKVDSSRRVESSEKEGISLVSTHIDADTDMFRVHDLDGDEVVVESEARAGEKRNVDEVVFVIDTANIPVSTNGYVYLTHISAAATTVSAASEILIVTIADELTLAQALAELKSARPPTQGISFREPSEATTTTTTTTITAAPKPPQDKGKGIMIEEPVLEKEKPMKKQEQMRIDEELTFKLQPEKEEERLAREKAQQLAQRLQAHEQEEFSDAEKATLFVQLLEKRRKYFVAKRAKEKRNRRPRAQQRSIMCTYLKNMEGWKPKSLKNKTFANIQELFDKAINRRAEEELEQESSKKKKLEEDKESEELKQCLEIIPNDGDDVTIDATHLSTKSPTIMLKNFDREDLEVLWSIVKARFKKTGPVNYMDNFLLLNLKTMFEHHDEDNVWKNQQGLVKVLNWKLYDSYGVHCVTMQNMLFYLLVEKIYPFTNHTLHQMFNDVKLQVDYECEMAFELLILVKKQLKEGYVPE
ncbi:hypothetical protein Tco_0228280 [Tanacetum coccineum]